MAANYSIEDGLELNNNNNSISKLPMQNGHAVVDNFLSDKDKRHRPFTGRLSRIHKNDAFKIRSNSSTSIEIKDLEFQNGDVTGSHATGCGVTSDAFIRVRSARQSKKLDTSGVTHEDQGQLGASKTEKDDLSGITSQESTPSEAFQQELCALVNEITTKVLIDKPENIHLFIADYLDDKLKMERQKKIDPRKKLKRQNSRVGKMLFRQATLLTKMNAGFGTLRDSLRHNASHPAPQKLYFHVPQEKELKVLDGHKGIITQCTFFKDHVISSSLDTKICIFNAETGERVASVSNHKPVHCFALFPTDKTKVLLLAGTEDGQVPIWRVRFGSKLVTVKLKVMIPMHQPNPIRAISLSPDHRFMATGCCFVMNQISLWGQTEPSVRGTLKTWDLKKVTNYALKPKEFYDDINHENLKTYKQIIARTESLQKKMSSYSKLTDGHEDETFYGIRCLTFVPDGSKIIVGFGHPEKNGIRDIKMMAIVDYARLETVWVQYGEFYQLNAMGFDPTCIHGKTWPWTFFVSTDAHLYLATLTVIDESGDKSKIRVKFPWRLDFDKGNHQGGTFSPDGSMLVTSSGKYVQIFESSSGNQLATYAGHKDRITHVAFSDDGRFICTSSIDKTVRIWKAPVRSPDPPKGKSPLILDETKVTVNISPDVSSPDDVKERLKNETENTTTDEAEASSDAIKGIASLFAKRKPQRSGVLPSVQEQGGEDTVKEKPESSV